jgi:DNA-binding MarR family transcriptional regulator
MAHFARIERQHQANANALLKPHGLKHLEWRILALTDELGDPTLGQIVDLVVIERTTIGKLVERMVQRGWLTKERSGADARAVKVRLALAGQRVLRATVPAMIALMESYSQALDAGQFEWLMSTLEQYGRQVERRG